MDPPSPQPPPTKRPLRSSVATAAANGVDTGGVPSAPTTGHRLDEVVVSRLAEERYVIWSQFQELCTFDRISDPHTHFATAFVHMTYNRYNNVLANEATLFPPLDFKLSSRWRRGPREQKQPLSRQASGTLSSWQLIDDGSGSTDDDGNPMSTDYFAQSASASRCVDLERRGSLRSSPLLRQESTWSAAWPGRQSSSVYKPSVAGDTSSSYYPYINANLLDSEMLLNAPLNIVASQAPLPGDQIGDWWAVIAAYRVPLIIMLTRVQEGDTVKAYPYWPLGDKPGTQLKLRRGVTVTLLNTMADSSGEVITRRLEIQWTHDWESGQRIIDGLTPTTHVVDHVQYLAWPDFGVPQKYESFQLLVDRLTALTRLTNLNLSTKNVGSALDGYSSAVSDNGLTKPPVEDDVPVVVIHCSAGIGRTGTLIAAFVATYMREAALNNGASQQAGEASRHSSIELTSKTIFEIVRRLKTARTGMVQRPEQLHFIYRFMCLPPIPNSMTTV